ncbi:uncharacterized protein A1O9_00493 [Exophiala aquamarina CBS 119918]|uniref:3-oxoacyl-[acyl-carrier protein] reductase n=1 Tax=Exophiala aquamarina CBS 119918 TaxID=1182545 RepID=A0A072Q3N7_9EURO|nr:uncharacterized protein A1O9_00493 [Exophiala aquamarina CBS 119918]KEF62520.1 hypothetical protein A1O9_00493 [Exophiala aquamarina CBS 119918]
MGADCACLDAANVTWPNRNGMHYSALVEMLISTYVTFQLYWYALIIKPTLTYKTPSDPKSCFTAVETCIEKLGRIDVLFHNAGRLSPIVTVVDHDVDDFNKVIMTNLCGAFYLAKAVIPHMKKHGKGVIVNTASVSGIGGDYGLSSYNAAKGGLINLTRTIAIDHARDGIRAVTVCPGFMDTPLSEGTLRNEKLRDELFESIPMNRGGHPKEVAQLVLFLASEEASYITGHRKKTIGNLSD